MNTYREFISSAKNLVSKNTGNMKTCLNSRFLRSSIDESATDSNSNADNAPKSSTRNESWLDISGDNNPCDVWDPTGDHLASKASTPKTSITGFDEYFIEIFEESPCCVELSLIMDEIKQGLQAGNHPVLAEACSNGAYFMKGPTNKTCAIFKPMDEEAGSPNSPHLLVTNSLKDGIRSGEGAVRECAAYLIDRGMAGVPPTSLVSIFINGVLKTGSLQSFVEHECTAEDLGPKMYSAVDVQSIAVLDLILLNQDRHIGNILVQGKEHKLIPIDHGYCLPHPTSLGEADFAWHSWPQTKAPTDPALRERVLSLDAGAMAASLEMALPQLPKECLLTLRIGVELLQCGIRYGCTLHHLAALVMRADMDEPSKLEVIVQRVSEGMEPSDFQSDHEGFIERLKGPITRLVGGGSSD